MQGGGEQAANPGLTALVAAAIAAVAAGGGLYLWHRLGWQLVLNIHDPAFNPVALGVLALFAVAVWKGISALRWYMRMRQTGAVRLELARKGAARLGQALAGRIVTERPVKPVGDYKLVLTCFDLHELGESEGHAKRRSFPVWTAEVQVDRSSDSTKGLAFSFALPGSVGPKPVPSGIVPGATRQSLTTLHIPGMARVVEATNRPPIERYWVLKATAPTAGPDFLAEFTLDVED